MMKMLRKEMRLAASPLSYLFLAAGFLFLVPGYPVLLAGFFICLGLFQSYQTAREGNDLVYSALLPVAKADTVRGKYLFALFIETGGFVLCALCALLRMTVLRDAPAYLGNALMNANAAALGFLLLIFGEFNALFIGGFFRTAYKFGWPFISFIIVSMLTIGLAEALHYFPGLGWLNAFGFDAIGPQLAVLGAGALLFAVLTLASLGRAIRSFEKIDL